MKSLTHILNIVKMLFDRKLDIRNMFPIFIRQKTTERQKRTKNINFNDEVLTGRMTGIS